MKSRQLDRVDVSPGGNRVRRAEPGIGRLQVYVHQGTWDNSAYLLVLVTLLGVVSGFYFLFFATWCSRG